MMARRTCVGATKRAFRSDTVLAFDRIIENQRVLVDYLPLLLPSHAFSSFSSDALGGSSEDPQQSSSYRRSLTIHQSLPAIRSARQSLDPSVSVGFVPTMGALHEGTIKSRKKLFRVFFQHSHAPSFRVSLLRRSLGTLLVFPSSRTRGTGTGGSIAQRHCCGIHLCESGPVRTPRRP